ncbi:FHA domain-containing protein [Coleofasciculus sp. G2-EDA-02]|uniref:FHA domain-containing protein n=1 Tax=Coleofasciculus sp. G2-EDA-02 TaxID=3069529 RepID=UPI0032FAFF82
MENEFYIQIDQSPPIDVSKVKSFKIGRILTEKKEVKFLINDRAISATHCTVLVCKETNPHFWVWDGDGQVGSKNKTIVNGLRSLDGSAIQETDKGCPVFHGDFVNIANHTVKFLVSKITSERDATL